MNETFPFGKHVDLRADANIPAIFNDLAKAAMLLPRHTANPIGVFDQLPFFDGKDRMRFALIEEWRRRKHEFPWYFPF